MGDFLKDIDIQTGAIVVLLLCWAFNLVYTAVQNAKKVQNGAKAPFERIDACLNDLRNELEMLKRRVDSHDDEVKDLHTGQSAMCRGVQALLEHELHNGNEEEMKAAADGIGKWLRTR